MSVQWLARFSVTKTNMPSLYYQERSGLLTCPNCLTVCMPLLILPKTACFPSSHEVGARVIKNWEPLVSGPELAIL